MVATESQGRSDSILRILHWNVHSWIDPSTGASNADAVRQTITVHEPDIISFVEVDEAWHESSVLAKIAAESGYSVIFVPTFEYGTSRADGGFGNAVLARRPIRAVEQRQLVWPPAIYDGSEESEPRSVLLVTVECPDGTMICVGSTHLPRADPQARTDALDRLTVVMEGLSVPWIICGDFNTSATAWLDHARPYLVAPDGERPTYPATNPRESIDYAVASPNVRTEGAVLPTSGSDHLPILVLAWVQPDFVPTL